MTEIAGIYDSIISELILKADILLIIIGLAIVTKSENSMYI